MPKEKVSFRLFMMAVLALIGLTLPAPLPAQELSQKENISDLFLLSIEDLMNIKVTVASTFLEPDLLVGSSVARINPDHWKRLGARRMTEALINQTALMIIPATAGYNSMFIRGYAADTSGLITMIDGVPVVSSRIGASKFTEKFGLGTLNYIELIKGPGSAIYGSDAFHGVVSYETFSSDEDYYYAEAAGAYPFYGDASMKVSHGLADDRVRIDMATSLSGQDALNLKYPYKHGSYDPFPGTPHDYHPGQVPGEGTGSRENKDQTQSGVFKLTLIPEKRTRIRLGTYIARNKFEGFPGLSTLIGNLKERDTGSLDSLFLMGTGNLSYRYDNDITLETSGYYWWSEEAMTLMVDEFGTFTHLVADEYRAGLKLTIKQPDNAMGLQWFLAYAFSTMKIDSAESTGYNAVLNQFTVHHDELYAGFSRDIHSLFGQIKYGLIKDRLYLLMGSRLDNYSDFGNQVTPRGGLIYLPIDELSVKALYGRGFMAADGRELRGIKNFSKGDKDLKPEEINVYELIVMYHHERLKATVNGFYSLWKDGIIGKAAFDLFPEYLSKFVNEGKNESYGGEFNLLYSLNPFAIELGFSYVKSSALNVADPEDPSGTIDQAYVAFPEYFINVGLYYSIEPWAVNVYLNNRFYFNMKETHYSRNHPNPNDLPSYWRTDLNVSKVIAERAEVILDVRNLFDQENQVPSFAGSTDGIEEPGISVLLRLSYEF